MKRKKKEIEDTEESGCEINIQGYYLDCYAHPQEIADFQYSGQVEIKNEDFYIRRRFSFTRLYV